VDFGRGLIRQWQGRRLVKAKLMQHSISAFFINQKSLSLVHNEEKLFGMPCTRVRVQVTSDSWRASNASTNSMYNPQEFLASHFSCKKMNN
jgi:hypothetical protein